MNISPNILVCVTQQKTCERLIRAASELRDEADGQLFVLHVAKNDWSFLDNKKEGEALEYLFGISKAAGAHLTVLKSDEILQTIAEFVKENKIQMVVAGKSPHDHKENNFLKELKTMVDSVEIKIIPPT